jgi:hypothetical protein
MDLKENVSQTMRGVSFDGLPKNIINSIFKHYYCIFQDIFALNNEEFSNKVTITDNTAFQQFNNNFKSKYSQRTMNSRTCSPNFV